MDYFQQRWNQDLDLLAQRNSYQQQPSFWGSILGMSGSYGLSGGVYGSVGISPWQDQQPNSEGWYDYMTARPPKGVLLQFAQGGRLASDNWVGYDNFPPESNAAYLMWRLTGIGKHQLESR